jgi:hypothetical protein
LLQEIGDLESFEEFTLQTSYGLRWFPYELMNCENIISSTVSNRALFGNSKNSKPFFNLEKILLDVFGGNKCSMCKIKES